MDREIRILLLIAVITVSFLSVLMLTVIDNVLTLFR